MTILRAEPGKVLRAALIALPVIALALYALFQAWPLIRGPVLTLDSVQAIQTELVITVTGTAKNVTSLSLNGRPLFTDEAGHFSERVALENGYTILMLRAEDRYGRVAVLTQPLVFARAYEEPERTF